MECTKIILRIVPKYLEELGKALDIFSHGDENKQRCVEFVTYILKGKDCDNKSYTTILVPIHQAIKECGTNNTGLPKSNHWILGNISLDEKKEE